MAAEPVADGAEGEGEPKQKGAGDGGRVLLVIVVPNADALDELVTAMLDLGVPGTIVEGKGLLAFVRDEMPIFSGLAAMMPKTTASHVVLSITTREKSGNAIEYLEQEAPEGMRPIAAVVPLERAFLPGS